MKLDHPIRPETNNQNPVAQIRIEYRRTSELIPYAWNPLKNDHAVERMRDSYRAYGGVRIPLLVRGDQIIDGHLRLKAALAEGYAEVPVVSCDDWNEEQVKAFRLLANRSATWAGFDPVEIDDILLRPEVPAEAEETRSSRSSQSASPATCGSAGGTACCVETVQTWPRSHDSWDPSFPR